MVLKRVADVITWARSLIAIALPALGIVQGERSLRLAVILLITNWTLDSIDGVLARRSRIRQHSWIGDHDLEIDMLIAAGSLAYLVIIGFVSWQVVAVYLLIWLFLFWRFGVPHILGVLFQAPIYFFFIVRSIMELPQTALWIFLWILAAIIVTWPKFPKVIIPEFLGDFKALFVKDEGSPE